MIGLQFCCSVSPSAPIMQQRCSGIMDPAFSTIARLCKSGLCCCATQAIAGQRKEVDIISPRQPEVASSNSNCSELLARGAANNEEHGAARHLIKEAYQTLSTIT